MFRYLVMENKCTYTYVMKTRDNADNPAVQVKLEVEFI